MNVVMKFAAPLLEKFLVGTEFAVFAGVMQGRVGVSSFVHGVDFATGIGMRIDMNAGGALIELLEIEDLVDGLFALDRARMIAIHIVGDAGTDVAGTVRAIFAVDAEVLDAQFTDGDSHPAVLSAMIVDAANLADLPTDGQHFEEVALENQIPRVVALGVKEIRLQRIDAEVILLEVAFDFGNGEILAMNGKKAVHPLIDGHLRHGTLLGLPAAL
jgi:hypothetical protein